MPVAWLKFDPVFKLPVLGIMMELALGLIEFRKTSSAVRLLLVELATPP